jgi:hypothetical protein
MSKKPKDNKKGVDLPTIPEKYFNVNKLEETENRLHEDKTFIESLKKENYNLFNELKQKELEFVTYYITYFRSIPVKYTKEH